MNSQDHDARENQAAWRAQKKAPETLLANVLARLEQRQPYLQPDLAQSEQRAGLTHPAWEIRAATVRALDGRDDALTLELLRTALEDEHRLVRVAALRVAGHMKKHVPLEYLLCALSDSDWEVREMAVLALGELQAQTVDLLPALLRVAQHDPDGAVRDAARYALSCNHGEQVSETNSDAPGNSTIQAAETIRIAPPSLRIDTISKNIGNACWHYVLLLHRQCALLHKTIWLWSFVIILFGTILSIVALEKAGMSGATFYLALFACISASSGTAFLYGGENDAGLELTMATPTSIRVVMLSRFLLLVGYNLLLSLLASGILALLQGGDIWGIIHLWLAPVVLFAMTAFSISLLLGSWVAVLTTLLINASRALNLHIDTGTTSIYLVTPANWQINSIFFIAAAILLLVAIIYAPRQPRLAEM
ncbi:HEAT repeat domain-containing protein [Dictyobacter aurantiacus]|uniref:HEAT repeat domain-containing protein n=1 Tax=Dictyobacter aurantiacus TaxID=1936993 RepID=A0A401ZPE3_9CHLR|nr:HEAT repeat domain-containing protein [Dictyobacter aurantiacus]GCE08778.1 hypothetical protein KDAU_61070 [Dictyobacter aurantiacus]